jgi:hypothetical protein
MHHRASASPHTCRQPSASASQVRLAGLCVCSEMQGFCVCEPGGVNWPLHVAMVQKHLLASAFQIHKLHFHLQVSTNIGGSILCIGIARVNRCTGNCSLLAGTGWIDGECVECPIGTYNPGVQEPIHAPGSVGAEQTACTEDMATCSAAGFVVLSRSVYNAATRASLAVPAGCSPCVDGWTTDTSGSTNREACCKFDCVSLCVQATNDVCEQGAVRSCHVSKLQQRCRYST